MIHLSRPQIGNFSLVQPFVRIFGVHVCPFVSYFEFRDLSWDRPCRQLSKLIIPLQVGSNTDFKEQKLVVSPVLEQGATTVNGVFPGVGKGEVYYDWYTLSAVNASAGENVTIDAPLGHIPVYLRGNNVIPTQEPALVTRDARKNPWGVIAALSLEGSASGSLYVDDGASLEPNATLYVEVRRLTPSHPP